MKRFCYIFPALCLIQFSLFAQSDGDYRSIVTGNWSAASTWERFNGTLMVWEAAATAPTGTDGIISVRDGDTVTVSAAATADQVVVDSGGTMRTTSTLTLANGTGDDLVINGLLLIESGGIHTTTGGNAVITSDATCIFTTASNKSITLACSNNGSIDWQNGNVGITTFINNSEITINGNNQLTPAGGNFTNNGMVIKNSAGTSQFTGTVNNADTIQINAGTWQSSTFNQNAGGVITGMGNFTHSSTLTLNADLEIPVGIVFSSTGNIAGTGSLTINNDYTIQSSLSGGTLTVNGNTTWASGSLGRMITNQIGRMFIISGAVTHTHSAPLTNDGTMEWQNGTFRTGSSVFTNNGLFLITGNNIHDGFGGPQFMNNGKVTKSSGGTSQFEVTFTNADTIEIEAGTFLSSGTFNQNAGGVIIGTGNFQNVGTLNINTSTEFPAGVILSSPGPIAGAGSLTINNDFTIDDNISGGALVINGNTNWMSGSLSRTFTNQPGRTFILSTASIHSHSVPLINEGTFDWQAGTFRTAGSVFTNNGTLVITGNNEHDGFSGPQMVNNGKILKTSMGTTTYSLTLANTDTIQLAGGIFQSGGTFNQNAGGVITGVGNFLNSGVLNINIDTEFPMGLTLNSTGSIAGTGSLTLNDDFTINGSVSGGLLVVNGNTQWMSGSLSRTFTNQAGRILTLTTSAIHSHSVPLINEGTLDWQNGIFRTAATTFTNNGTVLITGNNAHDGFTSPQMINNGTVSKSSAGTTSYSVTLTNSNTGVIKGTGTISFSSLINNGTIEPGLSPGILTLNGSQLFSDNSSLHIEMFGDGGAGDTSGHDQLKRSGNLALNGALSVTEHDSIPDGLYTVVELTSGAISGEFDTIFLPHFTFLDTITATAIILEKENPTVTCPADTMVSADTGLCHAVVNNLDPLVTPEGTDFMYTLSGATAGDGSGTASGLVFNVGVTTVMYAITLAPQVNCMFTVTVNDEEVPVIDCPDDISMTNDPGICGATISYSVTSDDNCPDETVMQTNGLPSGSTFPVGMTTNTFVATDASGNSISCSFTVTVNDTEFPSIDCPDDVSVENDPGMCEAVVSYSVTADDNCPGETVMQTSGLPSGSTFPVGMTTNTFVVTDASGNSISCSFTITVNDTEFPSIDCPDDVSVENDAGMCGVVVSYSVTADDNCPGETVMQTSGLPSGSTFPVGMTTNTFVVTDASGNSISCSFTVTVNDTGFPAIDCPDDVSVENDPGICGAVVSYNVTADDNCPGETVMQTSGLPSGSTFPVGMTTNTFIATDASGNSISCSFTVSVTDTEAPTIDCPDDITVVVGEVVNYTVTANDNCPDEIITQILGLPSGNVFPVGMTLNVFEVTDQSGNTASCFFTVTVIEDDTCDPPAGSLCDDGDVCTTNDVIGLDCNCAGTFQDSDGDGACDAQDGCPDDPDKTEPGICGCGIADTDSDGDGTEDCFDGCPDDPTKTDPGICGCGVADTDADGDGTADCLDGCPDDPGKTEPGICGCGVADTDSDGDGTADCNDGCPDDPDKTDPGICGCGVADTDADGDGTADCLDGCPDDPGKIDPGICGCGVADTDSDGDGTEDCLDGCLDDPDKTDPGICGCGVADTDSDGDGTEDCLDGCPDDPDKTDPGICGCGVADADSDGDGTADCNDGCPDDPDKIAPGICGCGISDEDLDGDGVEDCNDLCPTGPEPGTPCDDGDAMTINDMIDENCMCTGTPIECTDDTQCDDGDPCTTDVCDNGLCLHLPLPDSDDDGTCDAEDACPDDSNKVDPGICGCGVSDDDTDGDGTEDCMDGCPDDPEKIDPGICGCGIADDDTDGDGTADCLDGCPDDSDKVDPGICGCGESDDDTDGDGAADCLDGCPDDPLKTAPGQCGCAIPDIDTDNDGTADCNDGCPSDPDKTSPGVCGCGNPEPGSACDDGNPETEDDIITTNCICLGIPIGENTCEDGIQNGDEEGIDCGGSCDPCPDPVAVCSIITVYVDPNNPVYDGPGSQNIWWIPAEDFDGGSSSASMSPVFKTRRYLNNIIFEWTTQGACVDASPNGIYNNRDQGSIYRSCLPVTNADFNKWRNYQLRISDLFGSDECYGKVKVVPQVEMLSVPSVHWAIPDIRQSVPGPDSESETEMDNTHDDNNGPSVDQLTVKPNPGLDFLYLQWVSKKEEVGVVVRILNMEGVIVASQPYQALKGSNEVMLDMHRVDSGMYIIQVQTDSEILTEKWIKVRR